MGIGAVDVAGPEGTGRIEGQMDLQVAAGEPGAAALERRAFNDPEAEKVLIEGERPRQIGNDEIAASSARGAMADDNAVPGQSRLGNCQRRWTSSQSTVQSKGRRSRHR